jgi:phosphatidylserine/phosphatidylglycerophosphate/cardiolipin synthase-like enzyme
MCTGAAVLTLEARRVRTPTEIHPTHVLARWLVRLLAVFTVLANAAPAAAQEELYFPAVDDVATRLVQRINAESVRIDMSVALLNDRSISQALVNRLKAGVPVRVIGDSFSLFEADPTTKAEFYWLASQGIPIRLRFHPTWYPEVAHWKATIFAGQNMVAFGSTNYTTDELKPASASNYTDGTVLFTSDLELVNAFKSQFDRMWHDTSREIGSRVGSAPYFLNWNDACAAEPDCADYFTQYPNPVSMNVDTTRLEADHPTPADLIWSQGPAFNSRVIQEINRADFIDLIVFRLTVAEIADALLARHAAGVPVRIIIEPTEYQNTRFPEFWLTRANIDRLHAAGVPIRTRAHQGLTRMTTLTTQLYTTVASSNMTSEWQRDHNYFVSPSTKSAVYTAIRNRFNTMWNNASGFVAFAPEAPQAAQLQLPANGATGVSTNATLVWRRAAFATSYEIHLNGSKVADVPAQLVNDPPLSYSWTPANLQPFTSYQWRVVSRTNAGQTAGSSTWSFTTGELANLGVAPTTVELGAAGGSGTLAITTTSGGVAWSINENTPWISLTPTSGAGSATVTYTVTRNDTRQFRSATVLVNDIWVTFNQAPAAIQGPPTGLSAVWSPPNVVFTWQPPSNGSALRYQLDIANNAAFSGAFSVLTANGTPSHQLPGLREGLNYIRVSAVNEAGIGVPSETVTLAMPLTASHPPVNLGWSAVGNSVTLTWDAAPTGGSPIGYIIEAGFAPGRKDVELIHYSTTTTWSIDGVPNGVYYVRMRAGNGLGISAPSSEMIVYVGVPPPPAPPVNLSAQVSGSTVTLTWGPGAQGNAGPATHFILEAGYSQNVMNIGQLNVGANTTVSVADVPPGLYYVRMRAANGTGWSGASNTIAIAVP